MQQRFQKRYGEDKHFGDQEYAKFLRKWTDLSEYVREIKQTFSRYFNKRHNRRGFFWGERFKSLIVEEGLTLVNLLAYIDLNPIRAGIVKRPEEYKWCSLGHHVQTGNTDSLLSIDFGMKEWNESSPNEIVRKYREFVYETGAAGVQGRSSKVEDLVSEVSKRKQKEGLIRRLSRRSVGGSTRSAGWIASDTDAGILQIQALSAEKTLSRKYLIRLSISFSPRTSASLRR